jgi:hypothetical protein
MAGAQRPTAAGAQNRLIAAGILGIGAIVLAQAAAQLIDYEMFDLKLEIFNSNGDGGLFGVAGILASVLAAAATWAALPSLLEARRSLITLALLLTFLAADKALRLHDHVPYWLALYLPLLVASAVLLLRFAHQASLEVGRLIVSALVLLVLSFAVHQFGDSALGHLHQPKTGWLYQIKGLAKHGAELAGWLLVGLGVVAACLSEERPGQSMRRRKGSPPAVLG